MIQTPIVIVGGGPVGLSLALHLAWRDVPCMLVNEPKSTPDHPQGNTNNARTMEIYRRLGIAGRVQCRASCRSLRRRDFRNPDQRA